MGSAIFGPNTPIVLMGTTVLGVAGGMVGTFLLLRKRALMGDVVSHASLPGIIIAFILLEAWRKGSGKSTIFLLLGALVSGLLAMLAVVVIRRFPRIKEDAAMAIVLSVFFGLGAALLSVVQNMQTGTEAGLPQYIYGFTALIVEADVWLIGGACLIALAVCGLLLKEFSLIAFDEEFAAAQGWPVHKLDVVLMALVVGVTIVGLQAVGLLLVVAMLIIPAAAARFWTDHLPTMTLTAAALGGVSAAAGTLVSAASNVPAGPIIVLVAAGFFLVSLLLGQRRGLVRRIISDARLRRRVARQHVLRAIYESIETSASSSPAKGLAKMEFAPSQLQVARGWTANELTRLLRQLDHDGLVEPKSDRQWRLTPEGAEAAARVVRNHRLWELYLIHYADVAATHVDRDADQIEHVLRPELVRELEELLSQQYPHDVMPPSPHLIGSEK